MAFNDTYRESIQQKHLYNVGFTSTAKGVTNEGFATKNPHQVIASQIPVIDVAETYGPLVAAGIAAGKVEEHIVKLTADPSVNNNKAWVAYETDCITAGHAARGAVRLDQLIRKAETQYKLRVFERNSGNTAPDYSKEILPSDVWGNWEYDASAGTLYFDIDPATAGKLLPLWGTMYTYIGDTVADTVASGVASDVFRNMTDGVNTAVAQGLDDTLTLEGAGAVVVSVDSITKTVTVSGTVPESYLSDFTYHASGYWYYSGGFTSVPSDLVVYLNGLQNRKNAEYYTVSVVGNELRVEFAYTTHDSDWVCCTWGSVWSNNKWQSLTSTADVSAGQKIIVDTSAVAAYTLTLPLSPQLGDEIWFTDGGYNCGTVYVTLDRNGNNIMGGVSNLDIDSDGASFSLVYYNATRGWIIY